jgi:multifunctional beta-oxidation protein
MNEILFKDKVVVVTGAGGGLGKQYALAFAKRGARVVVNDLGGSLKGDGGNSRAADDVVDEIKSAGGVAVANYDSVEFGERIVETAIKNFGTVHIIINNAGILRDSSFKNMTEKDFQLVMAVHVRGAYKLTKAAWPYMRDQKYGRIVNTASPAGLFGNFGQANYSCAKSALIGFGETLAKEGFKYNIHCNIIAPLARSRMTEEILPKDMLEKLGPEKIVPLVLYLTHDSCKATNSIYEVAAGFYGQIRWERSPGELFKPDNSFTPEAILNKYEDILTFEDKPNLMITYPTGTNDYKKLVATASKIPKNDQGSKKISLKGKVVIVTGAGNGLGRAHALLLGKYGAKVVVNDIQNPDNTVNEIKKAGGEAVGNKSNVVTDAEGIVKTALDAYGRIDVLVNNAGILRDRSFLKMTDAEWDAVMDVHVLAPYRLSKLVWPLFLKQKSGTIINMTSTSGIYGNFGQANYAAAKCGIIGLTKTLAIEGAKHGIKALCIAPHAETAMTKTIFKQDEFNLFDPSQVSPFVVLAASDAINASGEIFEVGAGWVGNTRWQTAKGAVSTDAVVGPEFIRDHWNEVTDFSESTHNKTTKDSTLNILSNLAKNEPEEDDDDEDDEENSKPNDTFTYTERDVILYNLGLGATAKELNYVYEGSQNFEVIPSFGVIPFMNESGGLDVSKLLTNFNPALLLHGEQYLRLHKFPIPTSAELRTEAYPVDVQNKGSKAAVVVGGFKTYDKNTGELIFYNESTTFVRNAQAAGGSKKYAERTAFAVASHEAPSNTPDFEVIVPTSEDQAAIYRLSGDYNPLHIDPKFAAQAKFPNPILHGLASFGISVKQLYEKFGPFKEIKVRFTNVVYPGEHLKVKAWKKGDKVTFQTWSVERNVCVINNAALTLGTNAKL